MPGKETIKDRKKRIDRVIDYILKNLNSDISLQTLSAIIHYSPFHFQKLFKETMGVSPKQYIIQLRLETALHVMVIHPQKSVMEISIECGFSSPAVFSRAIKSYFGASPGEIRLLSPKERMYMYSKKNPHHLPAGIALAEQRAPGALEVTLKKMETLQGIYMIIPFKDYPVIRETFNELVRKAASHDLLTTHSKMLGILHPHESNVYKVFISVENTKSIPATFNQTKITGGKYATFVVKGGQVETLTAAHLLFQQWLPANGYKIGDAVCFESFSESPAQNQYQKIERTFFVPVAPSS